MKKVINPFSFFRNINYDRIERESKRIDETLSLNKTIRENGITLNDGTLIYAPFTQKIKPLKN